MKISIVIPAHNEESCLYGTVSNIVDTLQEQRIPHEVVIVKRSYRWSSADSQRSF